MFTRRIVLCTMVTVRAGDWPSLNNPKSADVTMEFQE
jgi:hypothetical protein